MQVTSANHTPVKQNANHRLIAIVFILSFLIGISLYVNNAVRAFQSAAPAQRTTLISQAGLEEEYGLRVNLVAVTAAGGFIDVRLKIIDGEKSRQLLADKQNFPVLLTEGGKVLNASEDVKSQEIQFVSGGNLFIIYPNSGNAIKPETPVTISFGNVKLESIDAK